MILNYFYNIKLMTFLMKTSDVYAILLSSDREQSPHRLEAFFDAVYAIVMTILVLGLTLPTDSGKLSSIQIVEMMFPQFYHFALSFFILCAFWASHHKIFSMVKRVDSLLIRLNFLILFITCLLPFTTTLSGDIHADNSAVILFDLNLLALGTAFLVQWVYIVKAGLSSHVPDKLYNFISIRYLIVPSVSIIACILVPYNVSLSSTSFLLILFFNLILIPFKPKQTKIMSDIEEKEDNMSLSISFSNNDKLFLSLSSVAEEMGISKEKLIERILLRWNEDKRIKTGNEAKLCSLKPDVYER
jgi:uncharacterized membrane protein